MRAQCAGFFRSWSLQDRRADAMLPFHPPHSISDKGRNRTPVSVSARVKARLGKPSVLVSPQEEGIGEVEFRALPGAWIAMCASRPIAQLLPATRHHGQRPNQLHQFDLTRDSVFLEDLLQVPTHRPLASSGRSRDIAKRAPLRQHHRHAGFGRREAEGARDEFRIGNRPRFWPHDEHDRAHAVCPTERTRPGSASGAVPHPVCGAGAHRAVREKLAKEGGRDGSRGTPDPPCPKWRTTGALPSFG